VFFGENVPKPRVERCYREIDVATALLVAGSSLTVMSGLRFVRYAAKAGLPVVIVNRGPTRGDELATVKIEAGCSEWLSSWLDGRASSTGERPLGTLGPRDEDVLRGLGDDLRSLA
jgi:NAD-dependent SIR2 family protein deacetylase